MVVCLFALWTLILHRIVTAPSVPFHGVGRINNAFDMLGVLEVGTKAFPVVTSTFDDN